nr:gliding motility-associated C-terminal domain-containing protein [Saprospiraceae bacterium]
MKFFIFGLVLLFFTLHISAKGDHTACFLPEIAADEEKPGFIQGETSEKDKEVVGQKKLSEDFFSNGSGTPSLRSTSCNETLSAGPDQTLCWPGGSVQLEGSFSGSEYLNAEWSPAVGLSDPNILQPVANVGSTTTYTLNISALSNENLIINGDFEMGNTGFTSDYTYVNISSGWLYPAAYSVHSNPTLGNSSFASCGDHTSGSGNMLIADGATTPGQQVWCQTVSVLPDTDYFFQFFVTTVFSPAPANIGATFNGIPIGSVNATSTTCEWMEFSEVWNSGGVNNVTICLENLNTIHFGNDFALDDISLTEVCQYSNSVTVTVLEEIRTQQEYVICPGEFVEVGGQQFSEPGEFELTLTSDHGCDSIIDLQIDLLEVFAFIENPAPITCENEFVVLDGSLSIGSDFEWFTFDGLIHSDPLESSITVGAPGTYQLQVTAHQNGHSCQDVVTVYVPIDTAGYAFHIVEPDPLSCSDSMATLQAVAPGLPPTAIIEWDSESGDIVSGSNTLTPTVQGVGLYVLTITDPNNGCFNSHSVQLVSDTLKPVLEAGNLNYITCRDSQLVLSVQVVSPDSNYVFSWTTDEGNFVNGDTTLQPTVDAAGWYSVTVTDTLSGCASVADIQVSEDFFLPHIELPATDTFPCLEDSLALSLMVVPDSSIYQFYWTTTNGVILSGNQTAHPVVGSAGDYTLTIENNNNGCLDSVQFEIIEECPCIARSGEFQVDRLELCEGEDIDLSALNLEGTIGDVDFELFYILHDGNADVIGNILAISQGASIEWSDVFESGTEYFIAAVISTLENGEINFDELCINFSVGIPVIWNAGPEIEISGLAEICLDESLFLVVESVGPFPFTIQLTSGTGETIDTEITEANQLVSLPQIIGETNWVISFVESECEATFSGEFTSIVTQALELNFLSAPSLCNNEVFGSTFDLNELHVEENIDGVWLLDEVEIAGGVVDFDGWDAGEYEIVFSTVGFEDPCPGSSQTLSIEVIECNCPVPGLPETLSICSDHVVVDLMDISDMSVAGEWSLRNPIGIFPAPVIEDGLLHTALDVSGVFELVFTLTDSLPEECRTEYMVTLEIEEFQSAGQALSEMVGLCKNEIAEIRLFDFIVDFSEGGVWLDENREEMSDILYLSDLKAGVNIYYYLIEGEGQCSSDEVEISIELLTIPEYDITTYDPDCYGESNGSILVVDLDPDNPVSTIALNGDMVNEDDLNNLPAGVYSLQITAANGCSGPVEGIEITEPIDYFISLGEDLEAQVFDEILVSFETNLPDSLWDRIIWSDDQGVIAENTNDITYSVESETSISISLMSVNGCLIEDEIRITTVEQDIYIPNVFRPSSAISSNAVFGPFGVGAIERVRSFQIFDRWGNRVHDVSNISPDDPQLFWDGKIKEQEAGAGVYVYQLIYTDPAGKVVVKMGDVLLIGI